MHININIYCILGYIFLYYFDNKRCFDFKE